MSLLEILLQDYFDMFGEKYPLMFPSDKTEDEIVDDIRQCLINETRAPQPEYEGDLDY